MARISTYALDAQPSLDDRVIGSDFDSSNKKAVQFSLGQIQELLSGVNSGPIISSIYAAYGGEATETNNGFFTSLLVDGVISTTTSIKINKISSQSQDLSAFFTVIDSYIAIPANFFRFNIKNSGDNTNFGLFEVNSVVDSGTYFTLSVTLETGAGFGSFVDETTYIFVSEFGTDISGSGVLSVTGNLVDNTDPDNPTVSGVEGVTGNLVDNTDPTNPVVSGVEGVTGNLVDNTDPTNPVINAVAIVSIDWAALVLLVGEKAGDIFDLTDTTYAGRIVLDSEKYFTWVDNTTGTYYKIEIV